MLSFFNRTAYDFSIPLASPCKRDFILLHILRYILARGQLPQFFSDALNLEEIAPLGLFP